MNIKKEEVKKMDKWLIPADIGTYDLESSFAKNGYADWTQGQYKYGVDDIVYIYCGAPIQRVVYKTKVEKTDMLFSETIDDKDFWKNPEDYEKSKEGTFVRLKLLEQVDREELSYNNLLENGLNGSLRGAMRLKENLLTYIEKYFTDDIMINDDEKNVYWLYAPGDQARKWDAHYEKGIMAIGWDLGKGLKEFGDWEELYNKVQKYYSDGKNHKTVTNMLWDFANTIKPGDIVFARKGVKEIVGLGIVESDYIFDPDYVYDGEYEYMHVRKVKWLEKGSWPYKNGKKQFPRDTIINITSKDPERLEIIKGFFKESIGTGSSFESDLPRNVIYFGAPGTGKSFNLNKDKDIKFSSEIDYERVTFHPDYSYANFVGTYKPRPKKDEDGNKTDDITYEYVPGPFMRSLVNALLNPEKPFLLIIEEINRANVAAVFGDVFQLLDRDQNQESKFPIETTEDMRTFLEDELKEAIDNDKNLKDYLLPILNEDYSRIKIPSNMFIWATMNSADQGVFPMDTAFKRRWDFEYFGINRDDDLIEHIKVNLNDQEISWNDIRKAINNELLTYKINEDKLLGPFFAFNEYVDEEEFEKIDDEKFEENFRKVFKNKIIMYLFEDAAKAKRDLLFSGVKEKTKKNNVIYSEVCDIFDTYDLEIFSDNIKKELGILK